MDDYYDYEVEAAYLPSEEDYRQYEPLVGDAVSSVEKDIPTGLAGSSPAPEGWSLSNLPRRARKEIK